MATPQPPSFASAEYVQRWLKKMQEEDDRKDDRRHKTHRDIQADVLRDESGKQKRHVRDSIDLHSLAESRRYRTHHANPHEDINEHSECTNKDAQKVKDGNTAQAEVQLERGLRGENMLESSSSASSSGASDGAIPASKPREKSLRPLKEHEEDLSGKYARKPRHKTKLEKYEYKGNKQTKGSISPAKQKRRSRRSRRKKTGVALNHDFKAPNVDQERLTLKPNTGPGIFNKGKASEPVIGRGLPDLTFSEMTFLTKRRRFDTIRYQGVKDSKATKKKPKGSAQEISKFFAEPRNNENSFRPSNGHDRHQSIPLSKPSNSRSHSSPMEPGSRRLFSVAFTNTSGAQAKSVCNQDSRMSRKRWGAGEKAPMVEHCHLPSLDAPSQSMPTGCATSYVSWSATPEPRTLVKDNRGPGKVSHPNPCEVTTAAFALTPPDPSLAHEPLQMPQDKSSITDHSIDRYTRQALLEGCHDTWAFTSKPAHATKLYSLNDLKSLARIAELEEKEDDRYSLLIGANQHIEKPVSASALERILDSSRSRNEYPGRHPTWSSNSNNPRIGEQPRLTTRRFHRNNSSFVIDKGSSIPVPFQRVDAVGSVFPPRIHHFRLPIYGTSEQRRTATRPERCDIPTRSVAPYPIPGAQYSQEPVHYYHVGDHDNRQQILGQRTDDYSVIQESFMFYPEIPDANEWDHQLDATVLQGEQHSSDMLKGTMPLLGETEFCESNTDLDDFDAELLGRARHPRHQPGPNMSNMEGSSIQPTINNSCGEYIDSPEHYSRYYQDHKEEIPPMNCSFYPRQEQADCGQTVADTGGEAFSSFQTFSHLGQEHQEEFLGLTRPHLLY